MDLTFKVLNSDQWDIYKELFIKIFNEWDNNQRPQLILLALLEDEPVGFATFIRFQNDTVYLQYVGTLPDKRSIKLYNLIDKVFDYLKTIGIKFVTMRVQNNNPVALISAIRKGFIPRGYILGFVEFVKEI